jgi:N-acetylmuramoyl-L-alanine amidase
VLKYGRIGDDVCELKKLLAENGFGGLNVKNRNYFGSTRNKVKAFQKAKGLTVDGKAGPVTITALGGFYMA